MLGGEVTEVAGAMETFVKQRPLPENPKKKGRVTVDDAALSLVRFANGALGSIEGSRFATGRQRPAGHIIGYEHTFTHTVFDFLEAMARGKRVKPDFEDGVRNQLVLEAIEKAARTRRWVKVASL